jgi:hypothetical protein
LSKSEFLSHNVFIFPVVLIKKSDYFSQTLLTGLSI